MPAANPLRTGAIDFLRQNPHSSVASILATLKPGYAVVPTSVRLKLVVEIRSVLRDLEAEAVIRCEYTSNGNLWSLVSPDETGDTWLQVGVCA